MGTNMTSILETFIKNMIGRLHEAGIEDPTQEDITCKYGSDKLKFRLYSQEQWDKMISSQNSAIQLFCQRGFSNKPDAVIDHKDKIYLVKLIK